MPIAEVVLVGEARSAGAARRFVAITLSGWNASEYGDVALLLVSELVTNAALHARTEVSLRIELHDGCLRLEVSDMSPRQPVRRHYSAEATTGRGLGLVEALARRWGVDAHAGGKTVWAELVAGAEGQRAPHGAHVDLAAFPDLEDEASAGDGPGGAWAMGRAA